MSSLQLIWQVPIFICLFFAFFITFIGEEGAYVNWPNVITFRLVQLAMVAGMAVTGYGIFTSIASAF